ncbi:cysteine-rich RLK (RECEPTOR-like protein kinase) 10 [Artemisia annua]|uniref:Cysteine-rich RLK (RECEPTOR-like protein kinase) 10 n=1 Tax=Artemisia annua TaxID=35608 RepID=A0A2U1QB83_ARTAN|nr:cysteine-rich RLK (RECEPTOR-like protein kinase) 10 [Artemisia annua]
MRHMAGASSHTNVYYSIILQGINESLQSSCGNLRENNYDTQLLAADAKLLWTIRFAVDSSEENMSFGARRTGGWSTRNFSTCRNSYPYEKGNKNLKQTLTHESERTQTNRFDCTLQKRRRGGKFSHVYIARENKIVRRIQFDQIAGLLNGVLKFLEDPSLHVNMIILTEKLPMWLVLVFICLFATPTLSQSDFLYRLCEAAANYTTNSTFEKNLDTTLSALSNTNSGFGFFNYSTGQGIDTVYSIALCRGDVNPDVCQRCLNYSIVNLRQGCPNKKEATVYYEHCLLKYSNQTLLGKYQPKQPYLLLWNMKNSSDPDRFNMALRPLLYDLIAKAATGDSRLKFAAGSTPGFDNTTIYGLVQCTPDLISKQCSDCLLDVINKFSNSSYNGRIGGRTLLPMCNFRYETGRFFNESNQAIPPPPSPGMEQCILS